MGLSRDTIQRLKDVLREAIALVFVDGQPVGTAFFISEDLLLTCAHVATHGTVTVQPYGRERRPAVVIATGEPDLALLRSPQDDGWPSPCVVLDRVLDQGDCFVAGFSREDDGEAGAEVFDVRVHPRGNLLGGDPENLIIEPGQTIAWGMGGGPVVSSSSGAVIAVIRTSKDLATALGGAAIPIRKAAEAFSEVEDVLIRSIPAMNRWRDVLGRDNWQRIGKSWTIEECVDLRVGGTRTHWTIRMDQTAGPGTQFHLTGADLGEEISEAIFQWALRRQMRGVDDVGLLGRLLAHALFPQGIVDHLRLVSRADSIFVRLHVEDDDLAAIPWELAAIPSGQDRFLAADRRFRFARVVDKPTTPFVPKSWANVRVLATVAQPAHWDYPEVHQPYGGGSYRWPSAAMMCDDLRHSIERHGFTVDQHGSPQLGSVRRALEDGARNGRPYDVLHYMGTGRRGADGNAHIVFGNDPRDETWVGARSVFETAARTGVRLIVLELMLPPQGQDYEPLTHNALRDVVGGSVNAAVLTSLPVHPDQCQVFNGKFYEVLGSGESVETAMQLAREELMLDRPIGDAAGFGCFTIVTGPQSGIRLVSQLEDPVVKSWPDTFVAERVRQAVPETFIEPALEQRDLQGRFPDRVRLGEVAQLAVRLNLAPDKEFPFRLEPVPVSARGTDITLALQASPGFKPRSQRAAIVVFPGRDSDWVPFDLKAVKEGAHTVRVRAFAGGTALGELTVHATVDGDVATSAMTEHTAPAGRASRDPGEVSLVIHYDRDRAVYRYQLIDWSGDVPEEAASDPLLQTPWQAVESLVQQLNALARGTEPWDAETTQEWLKNKGIALWREFIPRSLQKEFWDRRDRITKMTIISSGDPVPWELLYPFSDAGHEAGFLIDQFPVARRLGKTPLKQLKFAPADLVLSETGSLVAAPGEVQALTALLGAKNIATATITDLSALLGLLQTGEFGLLHFSCHNAFSAGAPNASRIMVGSQPFEPVFLERHAGRFATAAPLVFMNACRTDGQAPLYTTIDGWARSFLRAGVGAFVGTLWEVVDSSAATYAQKFYDAALNGDSLGVAARKAREEIRQKSGDPTWLAYTLYGDPAATVVLAMTTPPLTRRCRMKIRVSVSPGPEREVKETLKTYGLTQADPRLQKSGSRSRTDLVPTT